MGIGLITIRKEFQGQTWSNVHAFAVGALDEILTDSQMIQVGVNEPITPTTTSVASAQGSLAGQFLLHSLLNFERQIHDNDIRLTQAYISDGRDNSGLPTNTFVTRDFNLPATGVIGTVTTLGSGPIVLQVNKIPLFLSTRTGRGFFRAALGDGEIAFGGEKLITWASSATETQVKNRIVSAQNTSGLVNFMGLGQEGVRYCIPRYAPRTSDTPGALIRAVPVLELAAVRPAVRSVSRRRRSQPE